MYHAWVSPLLKLNKSVRSQRQTPIQQTWWWQMDVGGTFVIVWVCQNCLHIK